MAIFLSYNKFASIRKNKMILIIEKQKNMILAIFLTQQQNFKFRKQFLGIKKLLTFYKILKNKKLIFLKPLTPSEKTPPSIITSHANPRIRGKHSTAYPTSLF